MFLRSQHFVKVRNKTVVLDHHRASDMKRKHNI